jgi:hypothetical protein
VRSHAPVVAVKQVEDVLLEALAKVLDLGPDLGHLAPTAVVVGLVLFLVTGRPFSSGMVAAVIGFDETQQSPAGDGGTHASVAAFTAVAPSVGKELVERRPVACGEGEVVRQKDGRRLGLRPARVERREKVADPERRARQVGDARAQVGKARMDGIEAAVELAEPLAVLLLGLADLVLEPLGPRLGLGPDRKQAIERVGERPEERQRVEWRAGRGR